MHSLCNSSSLHHKSFTHMHSYSHFLSNISHAFPPSYFIISPHSPSLTHFIIHSLCIHSIPPHMHPLFFIIATMAHLHQQNNSHAMTYSYSHFLSNISHAFPPSYFIISPHFPFYFHMQFFIIATTNTLNK